MADRLLVYIGTYTGKGSTGIYIYQLDLATGELESTGQIAEAKNPSFLDLHPSGRYLYAVSEIADLDGKAAGGVSAFAVDAASGGLSFLNQQESRGQGPCHLTVDATGRFVLVANYSSGSVAALPIQPDGRLAAASDFVQHEGSSVNPKRQEGPHAHSIILDPTNRFAFASDLGLDKILIYKLDSALGKLVPNDVPAANVQPGAGPRHFTFHPNGKYAYVINELDSTMVAFAYNSGNGTLEKLQTITTLPADFHETNYPADVHTSADGRFLYGSNRGHDSIVIYSIAPDSGRLTTIGYESTRGQNPRNFGIDPRGTYLLVAHQDSDSVVTFRRDPASGTLTPTGHAASVPTPVCVKMLERP